MILLVKGDTVDDNRFWDQTDKSWVVWLLAIIYGLLTPRMMRIFKPVNFHSDKMVGDIFFGRTPAHNCTNSWYKYFWISYVLYIFFYHVDCFPLQWLQGQFDWTYMKICVQTFLVLNYASEFRYIVLIRFSSSLLEICFCQIMFEFSFDVPLTIRISFIASHCGLNACSRELGHGEICVKLCFARATGRGLRTNWQT